MLINKVKIARRWGFMLCIFGLVAWGSHAHGEEWQALLGGPGNEVAHGVIETDEGFVVV